MNDNEKVLKRFNDVMKQMGGPPKSVMMVNTSDAKFKFQCEACGGTIVAIVPTLSGEETGVIFWCLKCENTLVVGLAKENSAVRTQLNLLRKQKEKKK